MNELIMLLQLLVLNISKGHESQDENLNVTTS